MPQSLSKGRQTSVPSVGTGVKRKCSMVDSIPSSLDIKDEIDRHITQPNQKLAAEIADWAVQAYRDKIGTERVYNHGVHLPLPWQRSEMSREVAVAVENILIKKGWHLSHNFVTNEVYVSPTTPADKVFRGMAPFY